MESVATLDTSTHAGRDVSGEVALPSDYLSEVLTSIKLRGLAVRSPLLKGPWGVSVPDSPNSAVFISASRGSCWLSVFDNTQHIELQEGDLVLLTQGSGHILRDQRSSSEGPPRKLLGYNAKQETYSFAPLLSGNGEESSLIVGSLEFLNGAARRLFAPLPHVILLNAGQAAAETRLGVALRLLCDETNVHEPGATMISERIADLLLLEILRAYILRPSLDVNQCTRRMGILTALLDPHIGRVIAALIKQPAEQWTVESMAEVASLSRTAFAVRFTKLAGVPPLQYLTTRRMELATELLEETQDSLESIARRVGYDTASSFSKAFRRETGATPGQVRQLAETRRQPSIV